MAVLDVPADADDESKRGLGFDVVVVTDFRGTFQADQVAFFFTVFANVFLGALEDHQTFVLLVLGAMGSRAVVGEIGAPTLVACTWVRRRFALRSANCFRFFNSTSGTRGMAFFVDDVVSIFLALREERAEHEWGEVRTYVSVIV